VPGWLQTRSCNTYCFSSPVGRLLALLMERAGTLETAFGLAPRLRLVASGQGSALSFQGPHSPHRADLLVGGPYDGPGQFGHQSVVSRPLRRPGTERGHPWIGRVLPDPSVYPAQLARADDISAGSAPLTTVDYECKAKAAKKT
jgi:hypothetical protein